MRQVLTIVLLLLTVSLYAQLRLNVAGDAKITGRIDLSSGTNMIIGKDAGILTTGNFNTFLGVATGTGNTTGESNTFVGLFAGYSNTIGKENTFMGAGAGISNADGNQNTFMGKDAGRLNTTGYFNTFSGYQAGYSNTTGANNTFVGIRAGYLSTDRHRLVAIGDSALYNNGIGATSSFQGIDNTAVGSKAGYSNRTGYSNTFLGEVAGYANTSGHRNTFLGKVAGYANTSGSDNTFLGAYAGDSNTDGERNTFSGFAAGLNLQTGSENTFVGGEAGRTIQNGSNLTAFGYGADASLLSNIPINNAFVIGSHGLMTSSHSGTFGNISMQKITSYVNIGTASDGRMKKQVQENVHGLDFILQLRPVSYQVDALKLDKFLRQGMENLPAGKAAPFTEEKVKAQERQQTYESYLREKSAIRYTGFIAQEVEKAMNDSGFEFSGLVKPAHDKDHYSLRYAEFVVPLVKGMQEQQEVIEEQETHVLQLQSTVQDQQQQIDELKKLVQQLLANQPNQTPVQELDLERGPSLSQNQPNPFQENTAIHYFLPEDSGKARLEVYNMDGKLLTTLPLAQKGEGQIQLRAGHFPAGTYLYSLIVDDEMVESKRMVLTK